MQQLGFLLIKGEKILVLVRSKKYGVALKLRHSGEDGMHMATESEGLSEPENVELLEALLKGKVIAC